MRQRQPYFSVGRKHQPPHYRFDSEDYDHLQVIWVSSGQLNYQDASTQVALGAGHLALLRRGSAFRLWTEDKGYEGVYFSAMNEPRSDYQGSSAAFKGNSEVRTLAQLMLRELSAPGTGSELLLLSLGQALALHAIRFHESRRVAPSGVDFGRQLAESARQSLEATIYTGQSAREVLSIFKLSYRQLSRHFAAMFRMSPKQYQLQARLREAQRLLADTQQSITTIAYELGFSSSQHFATQFAQLAGHSPSLYRAQQASDKAEGGTDRTAENR